MMSVELLSRASYYNRLILNDLLPRKERKERTTHQLYASLSGETGMLCLIDGGQKAFSAQADGEKVRLN